MQTRNIGCKRWAIALKKREQDETAVISRTYWRLGLAQKRLHYFMQRKVFGDKLHKKIKEKDNG